MWALSRRALEEQEGEYYNRVWTRDRDSGRRAEWGQRRVWQKGKACSEKYEKLRKKRQDLQTWRGRLARDSLAF